MSYTSSSPRTRRFFPGSLPTSHRIPHHHSQRTIRLTTMQLSDMPASTLAYSQNTDSALPGAVPLSAPPESQGLPSQRIPSYQCRYFFLFLFLASVKPTFFLVLHGRRREKSSSTLSLSSQSNPIHASTLSPSDAERPHSNITRTAPSLAPTSNASSREYFLPCFPSFLTPFPFS
jgi:hypothetical protein